MAQENLFPSDQEIAGASVGDLVLKAGTFSSEDTEYIADYGRLLVPENREKQDSRVINLPVIRIHATTETPAEAVFLLAGGPAETNLWKNPPLWLLDHHDLVMVGYRGFDGSVFLETPEVVEAMQMMQGSPVSGENIELLGEAIQRAWQRFKAEGIDIQGYTLIETVDDMERTREQLGYQKINLYSASYGTRLAYLYGLRYPESIQRSFMYAINPPGGMIWEPDVVDANVRYYGELCKNDPQCLSKTPDLVETIQNVLNTLPQEWNTIRIDPDKVKIASMFQLFYVSSAAMVFDAFIAAENGDYSGLAFLSAAYDMIIPNIWSHNWGEPMGLAMTSDYDANRDYVSEMVPEGSIFGSPFSKLLYSAWQYSGLQITPLPEQYRTFQYSDVPTLMVNGSIDFSTPIVNAQKLLSYLRNGSLVIPKEMGHTRDVAFLQPEAFRHLAETFYLEGIVDDSKYTYQPMNFTPAKTFQEMAQELVQQSGK
jgi:pimeloyl-ACP methyl ester carboxylesterase